MWSLLRIAIPAPSLALLLSLLSALLCPAADPATGPSYTIQTVAGSDLVGDGGPAGAALLNHVEGVAVDSAGNLYIADADDHRIRKVTPSGTIQTIAGNGHPGFSGDGGPAILAQLNIPYGLTVDFSGNLYIADLGNARVRKIASDGTISTVAGGGATPPESISYGAAATTIQLLAPRNVATDSFGNLYISDFNAQRVYQVSPSGYIFVTAGTGKPGFSGDSGAPFLAQLACPAGLAMDRSGTLYIADSQNHRVRKIAGGQVTSLPGLSALRTPTGLSLDASGNLYIADSGSGQIFRVSTGGAVTVSPLNARDVAADPNTGNIYAADGSSVRKVTPAGIVTVAAGIGTFGYSGDGGDPTRARLNRPSGVARDTTGNLYIADTANHRIRKVLLNGMIVTLAGAGQAGDSGDGGLAAAALLNAPASVAVDKSGNVYIADTGNHRIRQVSPLGTISTIAGTGKAGYSGDLGPAAAAQLNAPAYVIADDSGNIYVSDTANHRVRRIAPDGGIATIAGNGFQGFAGDGSSALYAFLDAPRGLALDRSGNLYIADPGSSRVRRVSPAGNITSSPESDPSAWNSPAAVAVSDSGDLFVAETGSNRIRELSVAGTLTTIAGNGTAGFSGDGGAALSAQLSAPSDLPLDSAGNLYVADQGNNRIRRLAPVAGAIFIEPEVTFTVVNAASLQPGPVAPGEIVAILGGGLGPADAQTAQLSAPDTLATELGGAQVLFNGIPAPLLYAQDGRVDAQVPYEIAGLPNVNVQVLYKGVSAGTVTVDVADATPCLYTAIWNQDGAQNLPDNPAPRGSIVTLFATGIGQTTPAGIDGKLASTPLPSPVQTPSVRIGLYDAEILFAQSAPGTVGVLQINARVPAGFAPTGILPVTLTIGSTTSQTNVTVAVK